MIYHTQGEHTNDYNTDAVHIKWTVPVKHQGYDSKKTQEYVKHIYDCHKKCKSLKFKI